MRMLWYVLRSKPQKEMSLSQQASAHGHEVFFPHLRVCPVNPRSRKVRPYFPGYMFVHVDLAQTSLSAFQWMPHSLGLVSFDGEPAPVPEGLIHSIRRRVDEINAAGGEQLEGLKAGETVIIRGGPFDGYQAIFDARLPGSERVRVLLKLLQVQQKKLDLPAAHIERLKRR